MGLLFWSPAHKLTSRETQSEVLVPVWAKSIKAPHLPHPPPWPLVHACTSQPHAVVGPEAAQSSRPHLSLVYNAGLPGHLSGSPFQLLSFMSFKPH